MLGGVLQTLNGDDCVVNNPPPLDIHLQHHCYCLDLSFTQQWHLVTVTESVWCLLP